MLLKVRINVYLVDYVLNNIFMKTILVNICNFIVYFKILSVNLLISLLLDLEICK